MEAKGEVYDEMKVNFTNGDFMMNEFTRKALLKGSIYEYTSGGTIEGLLNNKFEDVMNYYEKYVNSGNCTILTAGDLDMMEHLKYFD